MAAICLCLSVFLKAVITQFTPANMFKQSQEKFYFLG